jgi:hypothetical protein
MLGHVEERKVQVSCNISDIGHIFFLLQTTLITGAEIVQSV